MKGCATAGDLKRIEMALHSASAVLARFIPGAVKAEYKTGQDPVTEADRAVDEVLRQTLVRDDEGWFSEETADDYARLAKHRVWVVDPLDGTREFVAGIPEWCVSVALVEDGQAVAGGICNPATGELFLGARQAGVTYNGQPVQSSRKSGLKGAVVLASRTEVARGDWERFQAAPFTVRATGSVAYKLALVAAGLADATWTLFPKHEWDIAAGAALVEAGGGCVRGVGNTALKFNSRSGLFPGLLASGPGLFLELAAMLEGSAPGER